MEQFYIEQSRIIEDNMAKIRSMSNDVNAMRENCSELNMSMAALQNPEQMLRLFEAEAAVKEVEAQVKAILGSPIIKIEDPHSDIEGMSQDAASADTAANETDQQQENQISDVNCTKPA